MSLPAGERGLKLGLRKGFRMLLKSLPAGERGLKFIDFANKWKDCDVAPRRGAWIEMIMNNMKNKYLTSRSPQGSVD